MPDHDPCEPHAGVPPFATHPTAEVRWGASGRALPAAGSPLFPLPSPRAGGSFVKYSGEKMVLYKGKIKQDCVKAQRVRLPECGAGGHQLPHVFSHHPWVLWGVTGTQRGGQVLTLTSHFLLTPAVSM